MSDIFEEVEEGLRTDKAQTLWNRAWPFVAGAVVAVVGVVGGYEFFEAQKTQRIETQGKSFETALSALQDEDFTKAKPELEALVATDGGFGQMAAHYLADASLKYSGDEAAAVAALEKAAEEGGPLGELALLKAAYFKSDTASLSELTDYIGDLALQDSSIGALAKELLAAKAFESGDIDRGRREYRALTLQLSAPEGVRARADLALAIIPSKSASTTEPDASEDTPVVEEDIAVDESEEDPA